jgi:glycosyltransferase involved in cell wall biosynthesis
LKFFEVIDSSVHGGAETHTRLFSRALLKKGHTVTLVCPPGDYLPRYRELEPVGGRVVVLDFRSDFIGSVGRLRTLVKEEKPQVLHSHKHRADFACALAARGMIDVRKISTVHNLLRFDVRNPFRRWFYYGPSRWALHKMDAVFAVGRFAADQIRDYFSLTKDRVVPLVNGIDLDELDAETRQSVPVLLLHKRTGTELWIGCVGRLSDRKGQDILLDAFSRLAPEFPETRLILVGGGPLKGQLERMSRRLGLGERVLFTGPVPRASDWAARFDVYVQPSRWDPVPRAMLEAMALGLPVIAAAVTGIPEIIEPGRNGFLVPKDSPGQLALWLKRLLSDPALRKRLGEEGKRFVRAACTMDGIAERILERV